MTRTGRIFSSFFILMSVAVIANGQTAQKQNDAAVRASAAFSEIILKETELRAEVEAYLVEYTEDFPKVKEARFAIGLVQKEKNRLLAIKEKDAAKLTLALGKLQVRKTEAEMELWRLQQTLSDGHPDVKRAKKRVEIYEAAINEILG